MATAVSARSQEIINLLEDTASLLQKTQINLKKCPKARLTRGYIETRIKAIEEYWVTYRNAHQELVKITPKEQKGILPYFLNEEYYVYEDLYMVLVADLQDILSTCNKSGSCSQIQIEGESQSFVRLPTINLPSFSGNYDEWPTFEDLFISLVHNNTSISDAQKLHYLKCSVTGEAEALLKHVKVTHTNYTQAWEILKTRYGNKRLIINSVLKKLINQKKMIQSTPNQLKNLLDVTTDCLNNLRNLKINTDSWDPIIIFLLVQKLDSDTHKEWEACAYKDDSEKLPTWTDFTKFLQSKYRTLEIVTSSGNTSTRERPIRERSYHIATTSSSPQASSKRNCIQCKGDHTLCHCKEFTTLQPRERSEYAREKRLCFNCLVPGHSSMKCRLQMSCRICKRRHHTLLHLPPNTEATVPTNSMQPTASVHHSVEGPEEEFQVQVNTMIASHHTTRQGLALLATAMVTVRNEHNQTVVLRALIDQGSQASFISEKATQMLKIPKQSARGSVIGVGSTRTNVNHVVQLKLGSTCDSSFSMQLQAYVMTRQLTTKIPAKSVNTRAWPHLEGLNLADPSYNLPGPIDLLLGVKEYATILKEQLVKGPPGTPCAQNTYLGWILFGEIDTNQQDEAFLVLHHQVDVDTMLKSLWEIDSDNKRKLTKDEQLCETIYEETHARTPEGRYKVKLPFKVEKSESVEGNTKEVAKRRLLQLERRFRKAPELKEEYKKVMREYITLNHMEELPENEKIKEKAVYLPHHAVVREDKETSKVRVVFDGSAKGNNNISLNDELLVGPRLQEDLRDIIMRWRMKKICYASDIQKMYRQVLVYEEDANNYQRVLWREDEDEDVKEYRLLRLTFGTTPAPYLAVKTLQQAAEDEGQEYPVASEVIKKDFYIDDVMSGEDNVEKAIVTAQEVAGILKKAGFILSKWSSNSPEFMRSINPKDRSSHANLDINIDGAIKALGIKWNLGEDRFEYVLDLPEALPTVTKRTILSEIQKLFDPLGWVAPCLITAKIFIQKLWLAKLNWDEQLTAPLKQEWVAIRSDLQHVNQIRIDRWLGTLSTENQTIQIHGFSDASMEAYAAVAYIRIENQEGNIETKLIASRTRVAPLRTISLPRLELCGALLLSKLLYQIRQAMRIPETQCYAWTDSSIVIAWLSGEPHRWKPFVANRVVEIIQNINSKRWFHVSSEENPADIASRGMLLVHLKEKELWWKGPHWLSEKEIEFNKPEIVFTEEERKREKIQVNLNTHDEESKTKLIKYEEFQNLKELITTITYCLRFLNFKRKPEDIDKDLTTTELNNSLMKCIKLVQEKEFTEEIHRLKEGKNVKANSTIKTLTPYLDEDSIVRVGGRLRHAKLDEDSKHPIILGNTNSLVPLIIADAHIETLHGGVQLMMCHLRAKYWIIRSKKLIKSCIHKCMICARQRAITRTQIMGDLPTQRVTPARAFLNSGVDFCGPFQITLSKGRGVKTQKAYIAVFVCMATKAIHLELVGDLTSEAFIGAFKRFVSRRGKCSNLWSDQGRNFVGGDKELKAAWQEANLNFQGDISNTLALDGTQWHFIPAYSPNFGGLWEAGVKSLKHHLKRVLTTNITFEEMTTVLCQVEACLNSRPLCPIDDTDPDCIEPLTPGHFLIGETPIVVPSPDFKDVKLHNLSRWQYTQKLVGDLWRRWQLEYLSRLQQRPKWLKRKDEFNIGDIVLIKTDGLPPGKWQLGRVLDKHPGSDGYTRVYSVKSGGTTVKRPVTKLCPLPIDTD